MRRQRRVARYTQNPMSLLSLRWYVESSLLTNVEHSVIRVIAPAHDRAGADQARRVPRVAECGRIGGDGREEASKIDVCNVDAVCRAEGGEVREDFVLERFDA
jgi:hypothetical protein